MREICLFEAYITMVNLRSILCIFTMNQNTPFSHKLLWKLKIPLKIKIFLWYLQWGVILTNDNLMKRNWKGNQNCRLCNCNKTIKHLFLDCHHAKTIRRTVCIATGLTPPNFVSHMLGSWLSNFDLKEKYILVEVAALYWVISRCCNDLIFENCKYTSFMQATFRGTYWLRLWALLQRDDETKEYVRSASKKLETTTLELFAFHGWKFNNRLCHAYFFLHFSFP